MDTVIHATDEIHTAGEYDPREQAEIIAEFVALLRAPIADGARKRAAGTKPSWRVDRHADAMYRHLRRWEAGELVDADSGAHPLTHVAFRALAIAWQETHDVR